MGWNKKEFCKFLFYQVYKSILEMINFSTGVLRPNYAGAEVDFERFKINQIALNGQKTVILT